MALTIAIAWQSSCKYKKLYFIGQLLWPLRYIHFSLFSPLPSLLPCSSFPYSSLTPPSLLPSLLLSHSSLSCFSLSCSFFALPLTCKVSGT